MQAVVGIRSGDGSQTRGSDNSSARAGRARLAPAGGLNPELADQGFSRARHSDRIRADEHTVALDGALWVSTAFEKLLEAPELGVFLSLGLTRDQRRKNPEWARETYVG